MKFECEIKIQRQQKPKDLLSLRTQDTPTTQPSMEEDSFYFSLLRISIAQTLKTQGFDKCKPSTLNTLTSLYIIYLTKLTSESIACSSTRTRTNSPEVQDVMQAMLNLGLIKATQSNKIHDLYFDELEYNTKSVELFRHWVMSYYGDQFKDIARRREQQSHDEGGSMQEELKSAEQDDQQQQSIYQQFIPANDQSNSKRDGESKGADEDELSKLSTQNVNKWKWLNHLLEKDLKLGHKLKYLYATEFIANEFEDDLLREQVGSSGVDATKAEDNNELDLDLQLKIQHIRNNEWNDYIVKPISSGKDKQKDDGGSNINNTGGSGDGATASVVLDDGVVDELVKKEADLEKYLPYKVKYSDELLRDDYDVVETMEDDADVEMGGPRSYK